MEIDLTGSSASEDDEEMQLAPTTGGGNLNAGLDFREAMSLAQRLSTFPPLSSGSGSASSSSACSFSFSSPPSASSSSSGSSATAVTLLGLKFVLMRVPSLNTKWSIGTVLHRLREMQRSGTPPAPNTLWGTDSEKIMQDLEDWTAFSLRGRDGDCTRPGRRSGGDRSRSRGRRNNC